MQILILYAVSQSRKCASEIVERLVKHFDQICRLIDTEKGIRKQKDVHDVNIKWTGLCDDYKTSSKSTPIFLNIFRGFQETAYTPPAIGARSK